jgi:glutathione S-transferase
MASGNLLITIPSSHYCEKARWALERGGISFREEPHAPLLSRIATRRRGKPSSVPVLVRSDGTLLTESTDILRWVDDALPAEQRLFPAGAVAAEVMRWEDLFDDQLGPHTRRLGYYWILPNRRLALELLRAGGLSRFETASASLFFPVVKRMISRGLKITPDSVTRSQEHVDRIFGEVSAALGDGRRYLTGDRFTAADLTFAALASPVVLPAGYRGPLPTIDQLDDPAQTVVARLRATPAGRFAARVYAEQRAASARLVN